MNHGPDGAARGPRDLGAQDFERIAAVMRRETGIELPENKLRLVQSRILRRLRALKLGSYQSYCDLVERADATEERLEMTSALTTNITGFFREPHHFEFLRESCIPRLASEMRSGKPVRIWSAGCSSGEEPYSVALTFLEALPCLAEWDFKILATDIDPAVLTTAIEGVYWAAQIDGVPPALRDRCFRPAEKNSDLVRVAGEVRDLVTFRRLNLIEPWPMSRRFDVILCRNVVIYFGEETKSAIWKRLVDQLKPGGVLISGHSERLSGTAAERMRLVATTTYRLANECTDHEGNIACH